MKFISFNINGLRARPHQLEAIIEKYQPDVIGLQEIKVADEDFPLCNYRQSGLSRFSPWAKRALRCSTVNQTRTKSGASWFSN